MNNHDPSFPINDEHEEGQHARLDMLAVKSAEPSVLARWQLALDQWSFAFVAFSRLGIPEIFTDQVAETFEALYAGSYDDLTEAAVKQLEALGWREALYRLRRDEGISDDLLVWDYSAVVGRLSEVYEFIRVGGKVHFFAK
jgi:hypothetical protein